MCATIPTAIRRVSSRLALPVSRYYPYRSIAITSLGAVGLRLTCPNCGERPYWEFAFGGEVPPPRPADETFDEDFERVWIKRNAAGLQSERWFHSAGCRRWLTLVRDTLTNDVHCGA